MVVGTGENPELSAHLRRWLINGREIREVFRISGSSRIVGIADDGSLAYYDSRPPTRGYGVISKLASIAGRDEPIDVVVDRMGDYLIVSGTQVHASGVPQAAVDWARAELADGVQVTAMAILNADAWIGVSTRSVGSGGMTSIHWGQGLLADIRRFFANGERIEDIAAGAGSFSDKWMIATDQRVFVRGVQDCRNETTFGEAVADRLSRQWDCHYEPRNCLAARATWSEADMASAENPNIWELNLLVTIGVDIYDESAEDRDEFECWLEDGLRRSEALFGGSPALRIRVRTERREQIDGVNLDNFVMHSASDYSSFMDEHFDIMTRTRSEGYFPLLISRRICIGYDSDGNRRCIGGRATFPHTVSPLTRKHGIIMAYPDSRDYVLAHELGHYFGIIHTFQRSSRFSRAVECNLEYFVDGVENLKCRSCRNGVINSTTESCSGDVNVMDYCRGDNDRVYFNQCQIDRAVAQRDRYMTNAGQTNYFKMKGRLGEPYCRDDSDCFDDEFCNTGVATIGRNVCKNRLDQGATCSRSGQCASGSCSLFVCRAN